ncbi:hypothetical protein N9D57_03305 [bacterium]|nr:hypothetical protein [bacterium]
MMISHVHFEKKEAFFSWNFLHFDAQKRRSKLEYEQMSSSAAPSSSSNAQPRKRDELHELSLLLKKYAGQSSSSSGANHANHSAEEKRRGIFQRCVVITTLHYFTDNIIPSLSLTTTE